ncbi:MAG: uroporphyrinogen-III C-methyltransferase [Actinomycetota bacterium]|nr:uroporphyrinogen-III C-methyltransferase [Actinomycetota bacterium]
MNAGPLLPLGLRVAGRRCVVVGGGELAHRRVAGLLDAGARITLISPRATPALEALATGGTLRWERRAYAVGDLGGAWYAVAATGVETVDSAVAAEAEAAQIFCTHGSDPTRGSAEIPAVGRAEPTTPAGIALVGGGPGDPGLLTLRGRELLSEADVVIADHLAPHAFLATLPEDVLIIDASKLPKGRSMAQQQINDLLVEHGLAGRRVVRLKGGDPFVFGRGMEEVEACAAAGLPVEVVPGVTSAVAVPGMAGIPVTHRGLAHEFVVVSGHLPPGHPESLVDWSALGRLRGTIVILMGVQNAGAIAEALIAYGRAPSTPTVAICNGGLPGERVLRMSLFEIGATAVAEDLQPPAVLVVGAVTAFLDRVAPA